MEDKGKLLTSTFKKLEPADALGFDEPDADSSSSVITSINRPDLINRGETSTCSGRLGWATVCHTHKDTLQHQQL